MRESEPGRAAVVVDGLSKSFRIPTEQVHTLKERALHPFRRTSFHELRALRGVSFEVERGEFFGVVGRNGSGKSTMMKCVAGIYRADAGDIWARGRIATFIELGVGFNPDLAAHDNVVLNAVMLGLSPAEARARYDEIIDFAELREFADLKLKNYSSGMHVRLAFSVMAHVDADVLLIDEVLAVGDAAFQQKCHDSLNALRDRGRTIVLVTHDMSAVQRVCDRAMLLERGELVAMGDPREVARKYNDLNFQRGKGRGSSPHQSDGKATIVDAWFEDSRGERADALEQGTQCGFAMLVEFNEPAEDPQCGFAVTDEQHKVVWAASSGDGRWGIRQSGSFAAGERMLARFRFTNVLAAGRHYVSPEVSYRGTGQRLLDYHQNAATVVVSGAEATGAPVSLPFELDMRRVGPGVPGEAGEAVRL